MYLVTEPACSEVALAWAKYFKRQIWTWLSHWMLLSLWHPPQSFRLRCPGRPWHLFQNRPSPSFPACSNTCPSLSPTLLMPHRVLYAGHCVTHAVISQNAAAKGRQKEAVLTGKELKKNAFNTELWDLFSWGIISPHTLELISPGYKYLTQLNGKQNRLPLPYTVKVQVNTCHRVHPLSLWNLTVFVWILVTKISSCLGNAF